MPNPKVGTVSPDVAGAVRNAKAGQVRYRCDKGGIVHCTIGKATFDAVKLRLGRSKAEDEEKGLDLPEMGVLAYDNLQVPGAPKGMLVFDIDLIRLVASKSGLEVKVVNTPWEGIFNALAQGDRDAVSVRQMQREIVCTRF